VSRLVRIVRDDAAWTAYLLDDFKQWARIDHTDDDASLKLMLASVTDLLERQLGISIAPAGWHWVPREANDPLDTIDRGPCHHARQLWTYVPVPFRGAIEFTVSRASGDVTSEFVLDGDTHPGNFGQQYLAAVSGAAGVAVDDAVMLAVGFDPAKDSIEQLPPALLDVLFRYALYIWENRESVVVGNTVNEMPDFLSRAWAPFWTPRV
jgi:hypothetical protein